mgnify:FL=1
MNDIKCPLNHKKMSPSLFCISCGELLSKFENIEGQLALTRVNDGVSHVAAFVENEQQLILFSEPEITGTNKNILLVKIGKREGKETEIDISKIIAVLSSGGESIAI